LSFILVNKGDIARNVKNDALERLRILEGMINEKITSRVGNMLEVSNTVQQNPFFQKNKPLGGLYVSYFFLKFRNSMINLMFLTEWEQREVQLNKQE